jgi:hypothetical protein
MEAAKVEQKLERTHNPGLVETHHITMHEFDIDFSLGSSRSCYPQGAFDRINAGRLPTLLCEINREAPHAAS